jgi:hypothetical protein
VPQSQLGLELRQAQESVAPLLVLVQQAMGQVPHAVGVQP